MNISRWIRFAACAALAVAASLANAQNKKEIPDADVIRKSIKSVGYEVGGGATKVIFLGTSAVPQASGEAKVEAKTGGTNIKLKVTSMPQPTTLGAEFLTYVLWTVTPDGTTNNIAVIPIDKEGNGKLSAKAQSQTFAMIVTAEPYSAVQLPSELVVLENDTKKNTKGKIYPDNSYKLMKRSQYTKLGNPLALTPDLKNVPLDMYEARNAVDIARSQKAQQYAPEIFSKAESSLQLAENSLASQADKALIITNARQTMQFAEDARALSAERQETERIQQEKDAAAAAAAAKAKAEADAEAKRQAELTAAREAQMKAEAAAQAAQQKAAAEAAASKAAAEQAALQAKEQAARDEAARAQAATAALRAQLLQQLNEVLQTTDTPRGLVVNMADVLFETGKYALSQDAQLKLAKLSGIIQAHPGLNLAIEGHTDTTGTSEFNMKLSQQRADTVREFLISQGLSPDIITAKGMGEADPVADNGTAAGRKQNRRVEIIVSGEVIGARMVAK
jgi:outer membrane protein OmpA-like peptidoglycan-associated protein